MSDRARSHRRRPPRLAPPAIAGALLLVWGGCSVEKHYELLSFFFDGVPPPGSAEASEALAPGTSRAAAGMVSGHPAYFDRRCSECHGDQARFGFTTAGFSALGGEACLGCHAEVIEGLPVLHGPVAARECVACHDPHASRHPWLLVAAPQDLCARCHAPERLLGDVHENVAGECMTCHDPHGGTDRRLLESAEGWTPRPDG